MENIEGVGSPACGKDGLVDRLFDLIGSALCE